MGAMGSKGGGDNTRALYEQQQADLAREKARLQAEENAARKAEAQRRDALRRQMLAGRDILTGDTGADTLALRAQVLG